MLVCRNNVLVTKLLADCTDLQTCQRLELAAVKDIGLGRQQAQGPTAKLVEQPQTGTNALHAVAACAVPGMASTPIHTMS